MRQSLSDRPAGDSKKLSMEALADESPKKRARQHRIRPLHIAPTNRSPRVNRAAHHGGYPTTKRNRQCYNRGSLPALLPSLMSIRDLAKLVFLASIWGGAFIFLRVAVPEVGPLMTSILRVTLAAIVLSGYAMATGVAMHWRRNLKPYAVVGLFAAALPFTCFSFAALYLPAAYSAVLNATAPLFGAVFSVLWLADRLTVSKLGGLILGIVGVAILVGAGSLPMNAITLLAVAACLIAAASYAVSSIIVKKIVRTSEQHAGLDPIAIAAGSLVFGSLIMAPIIPFSLPPAMPSMAALACIAGLSILSSGVGQAMFIPLIVRIGPTRAMSVTFLIPLFSMLWGFVFLNEAVNASTLVGSAIILASMGVVLAPQRPEAGPSNVSIDKP